MRQLLIIFLVALSNGMMAQDDSFIDQTFATNGIFVFDDEDGDRTRRMAAQSDGKILVAGHNPSNPSRVIVFRLTVEGTLDSTFGDDGIFVYAPDTLGFSYLPSVYVLNDDGIILAFTSFEGIGNEQTHRVSILKLYPNGEPDLTFSGDGFLSIFNDNGFFFDLIIADDQSIIVGGSQGVTQRMSLCSITSDGIPDENFANAALTQINANYDWSHISLLRKWNNELLVIGQSFDDFEFNAYLCAFKLSQTGDLYTEFGSGAWLEANLEFQPNAFYVIADCEILPTGQPLVLLSDEEISALFKFDEMGVADWSYGDNGLNLISLSLPCNQFSSLLSDEFGNLFLLGYSGPNCSGIDQGYYHIVQLNDTGEVQFMNLDDGVLDIEQSLIYGVGGMFQQDGKLLVCGSVYNSGFSDYYVCRLDLQSVVGVYELGNSSNMGVLIYPNPTSSSSWIHYPVEADGVGLLRVVAPTGQVIFEHKLNHKGLFELDVTNIPSGLYLAQLVVGDKVMESIRVTVVK
jgi:uncharacterized delta-60 repeat protein